VEASAGTRTRAAVARGQAWEMTRYRAYQAYLAGLNIEESFGRVEENLMSRLRRAPQGNRTQVITDGVTPSLHVDYKNARWLLRAWAGCRLGAVAYFRWRHGGCMCAGRDLCRSKIGFWL
jgi:hypothetical protein